MRLLENHSVLITGGGSGLGLGVARHCLAEGAQLAVMDISGEKLAALRAEFGDQVLLVEGSCTRVEELERCRAAVAARFGRLDALIGVQGIFDGNIRLADVPLERIDGLFDELFHVNVKGHVLAARVFYDMLLAAEGAIVLTSSTAAYAADGGGVMYSATKGAIRSIVHQLAFEFAPAIRVNGIAPAGIANSQLRGPAALGMQAQKQSDIPKDAFLAKFRSISLLQELPTPEDHGFLYAFLASRQNKLVTGQTIVVDQGLLNRALLSAELPNKGG
ncbi:SDR family oxidoreductase [Acidocella sp. KAb 2-4]|uniref:SDR family oxidoreductase n=1 Tax=Acidocella sp. KAb 2-4 TaxID=2885158 RepID=UPI001D086CED|nr:SDR family oxidoreductase [Acidocella sp. KAb 2-4]MCB5945508.1 SDR family oxidoreductase [Acidocella sp. KAb 2-4]